MKLIDLFEAEIKPETEDKSKVIRDDIIEKCKKNNVIVMFSMDTNTPCIVINIPVDKFKNIISNVKAKVDNNELIIDKSRYKIISIVSNNDISKAKQVKNIKEYTNQLEKSNNPEDSFSRRLKASINKGKTVGRDIISAIEEL